MKSGFAEKIARPFIHSKLTLLLMIAFLAVGIYSFFLIPREEEPQINVPMVDVFFMYPGASASQVESRIAAPIEKVISNIHGVEYVYSTSMDERAMIIVQYYVGENTEESLVKLYNELERNMDKMPYGISPPLIKSRAIDDVPMMSLTLWSDAYDDFEVKRVAEELTNEIEKTPDVSMTDIIGGRSREIKVVIDKEKLAALNQDILAVVQTIQANNSSMTVGKIRQSDNEVRISTGTFLSTKEDIENLVIGVAQGAPIYLKQVASVLDGPEESSSYVSYAYGSGDAAKQNVNPGEHQAVTIAISKKKGADAMQIAQLIETKLQKLEGRLIPQDIHVEISRNYGETASEKVSELMKHLVGAILAVTLVVMIAMGWRGGLVVFLSVPITFALTFFSYYFLDYTLNRITLFALVFVTGIVVDDSIIIAENMHRHFRLRKMSLKDAAIYAVNEVGNPTILATFTVIAAVLPMAFVSGLMGPYMSPMPIGASIAMIFSLLVAFTITPYLAYNILNFKDSHSADKPFVLQESRLYKIYNGLARPLINSSWKRWTLLGTVTVVLLATMSMFYFQAVAVKMLPFDNKSEFQIVIDMPEGTSLERTAAVTKEIGAFIAKESLVKNYQTYVGTAAPINFNGLVRHYDIRQASNMSDIQVNLIDRHHRSEQSHDICKRLRPQIQTIAKRYGANAKVVEIPPGPPVLSTIVAEIYGPNYDEQIKIANQVKELLLQTDDIVDVDWMVEDAHNKLHFNIDKEKAALYGLSNHQIVSTIGTAMSDQPIGYFYQEREVNQVPINVILNEVERTSSEDIANLKIKSMMGQVLPVGDFVNVSHREVPKSIYRKNQKRVVYVMADMAGSLESPAYAILGMEEKLKSLTLPKGYNLSEFYMTQPTLEEDYGIKWDGEWQVTLEVFRDLGIAFGVALIFIYILIVGWFQKFRSPIVMMVAIPLSLIGIILGHWIMNAYFTATSMIGMIALAGIMVRNSVLLIDFVKLRLEEGAILEDAVIEAGAVRTTPILLTAGTVVIGAVVILFDPIFQGLAISLMGGTIASTVLTLIIVPIVYYMMTSRDYEARKEIE